MTNRCISLQIFINSKSLFDVITKFSNTEEEQLIIDTQSVGKAYGLCKISNIGLIRSEKYPADAFTKVK